VLKRWASNYEISLGRMTPVVGVLLTLNSAIYLGQANLFDSHVILSEYALSVNGLREFKLWQIVTYMFLHGSTLHLGVNMLLLFMIGPETERAMGRIQFSIMYFLSGILGGVGWLIISAGSTPHATCVGASGAIFGIIGAFAALFPQRYVTLLLFFVIPITMKAWVMAALMGALELALLITHPKLFGGVANAAHLGGGLAGFIYARTVFGPGGIGRAPGRETRPETAATGTRAELERLLDKIDRQGMSSLTPTERRLLAQNSRDLSAGE
jgi:membrane associated rhomboid family serine protease